MNTILGHLPKTKQEELEALAQLLSAYKDVEMLILFGSYARGNWVEDAYVEDGILYEYRSDFDLLVVLRNENLRQKFRIEHTLKKELIDTGKVATPVSLIFHSIKQLNKSLCIGNYFFKDIKEEGIALYDSGNCTLAHPKKLTSQQYKEKALDYFEQWFQSGNNALKKFHFSISESILNEAAFDLHQATERYYTTILLIFNDYRPKDHNLETLGIKVEMCDKQFAVFPKETDEEKRLFELLKKAYIDARYKMKEFHISKADLEYLAGHVQQLQKRTEEICKDKILQIEAGK